MSVYHLDVVYQYTVHNTACPLFLLKLLMHVPLKYKNSTVILLKQLLQSEVARQALLCHCLPPLVLKARHLSGSAFCLIDISLPEQVVGEFPLGLGLVIEERPTELSCTFLALMGTVR